MATEVRRIATGPGEKKEATHFNETVELAKLGCQRSMTEIWNRYHRLAEHIVRQYVEDFDVDGVVSLAMTRAFDKLGTWDGTGKFESWLSVVIKRVALSHLKERGYIKNSPVENVEHHDRAVETEYSDFLAEQMIHSMIRKLPRHQRRVIECMVLDEMTQPEAAVKLGTTVGTIKSNMFAARQNLKKMCVDAGLR